MWKNATFEPESFIYNGRRLITVNNSKRIIWELTIRKNRDVIDFRNIVHAKKWIKLNWGLFNNKKI